MLDRMERSRKFAIMLQLFADGEGGAGDGGAGAGAGDGGSGAGAGAGAGTGGAGDGGAGDGGAKPFAVFPDEKSFMARIKREAKTEAQNMQSEFLKGLGVADADALKALIAADNKRKDDELTETDKLQKKIQDLQSKSDLAQAKAEQTARQAEAKLVAAEVGVNPSRINHFLKLADLNDVAVNDDGSVDSETIKTRLTALLNELPEFKGQAPVQRGGGDFGGSNNQAGKLTMDQIKKMTKEEIASRITEVREVLGQK